MVFKNICNYLAKKLKSCSAPTSDFVFNPSLLFIPPQNENIKNLLYLPFTTLPIECLM